MIERERERGDWGLAMCASLCDEILLSRVKIEIAIAPFLYNKTVFPMYR